MILLRLILALILSYIAGRIAKRLKFPPILGWLVIAMFLGEHGLNLLNKEVTTHPIYTNLFGISQIALGSMIGSSLVYRELKDKIKSVLMIGITDILVTFVLVSGVFAIVLHKMNLPIIGAVLFGVIAISTAPAPPVGLVQQYSCRGPLSDSVAPMTALNSVLVNLIFFPVVAMIGAVASDAKSSLLMDISIVVFYPIAIGFVIGFIASRFIKEKSGRFFTDIIYIVMFFALFILSTYLNTKVFKGEKMMAILAGISFACSFVNGIPKARLRNFQKDFVPIHNYLFMFFIVSLSKDLDPFSLASGGLTMIIYVVTRAIGKYLGSFIGAKISKAEDRVCNGIGVVMQPHSGVSIMFSGISAHAIAPLSPELADLIYITISTAALVIELISLPLSKKVYDKYKEIPK